MATVYRHGKQWIAQWYRADGSRVSRGTRLPKRREAERLAAEMESKDRKETSDTGREFEAILHRASADAKAGKLSLKRAEEYLTEMRRVADPKYSEVSLEKFLEGWSRGKQSRVKASTAGIYDDMIRHFGGALGEQIMTAPLASLSRPQIEKAMQTLRAGGHRGSTVNLSLQILRSALKKAVLDQLIHSNPAEGIPPLPEDDSVERAPFSPDDVRALLDHPKTSDEWRGMVLFGVYTGLRLSDVAQLGDEHVEGSDLVIRPRKTDRSKKTLRIPLAPPLAAWLADREAEGKFFPDLATKSSAALSGQFASIMKRAGVAARVTLPGGIEASRSFHSLRHSFASWLAEADIHADVRKKLTGHSSEGIHAIYTHHDAALKRAVETLPDIRPAARDQITKATMTG